jgi:hypothetical protein
MCGYGIRDRVGYRDPLMITSRDVSGLPLSRLGGDAVRHAVDHDFAGSTAASVPPELTGDSFRTHEASSILINDD